MAMAYSAPARRHTRPGDGQGNLVCSLCRNTYRSPKLLPCYHTFCLLCLDRLLEEKNPGDEFPCPDHSCRTMLQVPQEGARGFMENYYVAEQLGEARNFDDSVGSSVGSRWARTWEAGTSRKNRHRSQERLTRSETFHGTREAGSPHRRERKPPRWYGTQRGRDDRPSQPPPSMCLAHPNRELELFCVEDEVVVCYVCERTEHRDHVMEELSKASDRYKILLETEQKRLKKSLTRLEKLSDLAQDNLKAARQKADVLKEQVNAQHDMLVKRAGWLRDKVLEGLEAEMAQNIEPTLTADVKKIQETLESLHDLAQRVDSARMDDAPEAYVVSVAMEMKKGRGSTRELFKIHTEEYKPRYTVRPGLHSYARSLAKSLESDIVRLFGSPVTLSMVNTETSQCVPPTTPVPFYRCGLDGSCREVHAVCRTDDGKLHVAYGGKSPKFTDEQMAVVTVPHIQPGTPRRFRAYSEEVPPLSSLGRKITFDKQNRSATPAIAPDAPDRSNRGDAWMMHANSNGAFMLKTGPVKRNPTGDGVRRNFRETIVVKKRLAPLSSAQTESHTVHAASRPVAFDANAKGDLFVIVNEDEEKVLQKSMDAARTFPGVINKVRLYRDQCSDPIATYKCQGDKSHFLPTAVSFYKHGIQDLLLIADWLGNSVHMVHVASGDFRFLCYLTAGSGDLVRPTALDVDHDKNIWIGCENGWVLECPFRSEDGEGDVDTFVTQLMIANGNESPSDDSSSGQSSSSVSSESEESESSGSAQSSSVSFSGSSTASR